MAKIKQQDGEQPIEVEVLAQEIHNLNNAAVRMFNSGLKRETIVLLVSEASGVGRPAVRQVLEALPELAKRYCK